MINKISFTVFIPCYGECKYLSQTIDSLLDQDYELEIVLCPQGNTDVSHILDKYPMIKVIGLEKPSLYKARIFLFDKSKSDYIYYVDDDDIIPKGLFQYVSDIIAKTGKLDLYRIPLQIFYDDKWDESLRNQTYNNKFFLETKDQFLKKCFNGTYHNGVVHLFIKNVLKPKWFDVDVFQTEDRLITFSIANAANTDICIIEDAFYLYRKYPDSHSRTLNFLKGRDDFIIVNNCLKEYMNTNDLILNASAIVLRIISHLKYISSSKQFNKENFNKIYSNDGVWEYLDLFLNNKKLFKQINGSFVLLLTKLIKKKRYSTIKLLVVLKCKQEINKYGKIQF